MEKEERNFQRYPLFTTQYSTFAIKKPDDI